MTAIVGIYCKDGVVIGSDSAATFGSKQVRTIEQPIKKIEIIENSVIVAGTGEVGLGQRFCAVAKKAWTDKIYQQPYLEAAKNLSRLAIADFTFTSASKNAYGALVAFPSEHKHHLCEFSLDSFQPEFKTEDMWYGSMGCTLPITDTFLAFIRSVFWNSGPPSLQDAIFAVTWTLQHAIEINPGGVNAPIQMAVLEHEAGKLHARHLSEAELGEHLENINAAKEALRNYKEDYRNPAAPETDLPPVPKP